MPSKLRILFRGPGNPRFICGNKAIAMLSQFVSKECLLTMQLPLDWAKRNKYARLSFLAQLLPKGYELYLIREPKHTRKNKSLYLKMREKTFKVPKLDIGALDRDDMVIRPPAQQQQVAMPILQGNPVWYQAFDQVNNNQPGQWIPVPPPPVRRRGR